MTSPRWRRIGVSAVLAFAVVLAVQLWLVRAAGTDIPFMEQWETEGGWLLPRWRTGALHATDLLQPHNEHRIAWTYALDLGLFAANGQWDPLVELGANALLHALIAALLVALLQREGEPAGAAGALGLTVLVVAAQLPVLGWHNALWGFQSQVYFVALFALPALWLLTRPGAGARRASLGLLAGVAGLLAMGPGALVPLAALAVLAVQWREGRRPARATLAAVVLLGVAVLTRPGTSAPGALHARSVGDFGHALGELLAWPHVAQPLAAVVLNAPLVVGLVSRVWRRRAPVGGEDFVLGVAFWALGLDIATAWVRGGSDEFSAGVPSRYADLVVLLPLANAWYAVALCRATTPDRRTLWRTGAVAWVLFLAVGWAGLSAEMLRRVILPRAADRAAPVRLAVAFQQSGNPSVFLGQPRLLVPHPTPSVVTAVLHDPRMADALPPSFQPERRPGPLSRFVRWLLGRVR